MLRRANDGGVRRWGFALVLIIAFAMLLVADGAWVALSMRNAARDVRADLERGATALRDGDTEIAAEAFGAARTRALDLRNSLRHPAPWIASALPILGRNVYAAGVLADATGRMAFAGVLLARGAERAGWDGTIDRPNGGIDLGLIDVAFASLAEAGGHVSAANESLAPIDPDGLLGLIGDPVRTAQAEIADADALLGRATELAGLLPPLLGANTRRTYLLGLLNPSDPRGSGGYVGVVALLRADGGAIRLTDVHATRDFEPVEPVPASEEVILRYERFGATRVLHATTYPPDFPTSAGLMMDVWSEIGSRPVDGVIAADPVALSYLLEATGPVQTQAWPEPIDSLNAVEILGHDTFLLPPVRGNRIQEVLVSEIWEATLDELATEDVLSAIARAARERHLQVFSSDPDEEAHLVNLDAAGTLEIDDHPLLVSSFGGSANRAGYFAERSIAYTAVLHEGGDAEISMRLTLANDAPPGPPSPLLGSGGPGEVVGGYSEFENVYLPAGATDVRARVNGGPPPFQVLEHELGHLVLMVLLPTEPGGSASMEVTYTIPDALRSLGARRRFDLAIRPVPSIRPTPVAVRIVPPASGGAIGRSAGLRMEGSTAVWTGAPSEPVDLWVDV